MAEESTTGHLSYHLETSFVPAILKTELSIRPEWKIGDPVLTDHAAVLWLDICNFSPLCNRLMEDKKEGVEKITNILNAHYDYLLENITNFGGQPWFFVGDGMMSAWPCSSNDLEVSLLKAIACAGKILSDKHSFDDKENPLSIHCIVADGKWNMTELQNHGEKKLLSLYGEVFKNLKLASATRAPDQLLIANSSLDKISQNLRHEKLNDFTARVEEIPDVKIESSLDIKELNKEQVDHLKEFAPITLSFPLNRERLKWIAEIRPVTNIFVRLPFVHQESDDHLEELKEVAKIAVPVVRKYNGLLTQVWMDEKDSNMLICFGPPPSAHHDNPIRAIKLAMELTERLNEANYHNGIGICTGNAYCGLLGNDILRQYTIIGDTVNLSARLADLELNRIFCDHATFLASKQSIQFEQASERNVRSNEITSRPSTLETVYLSWLA